MSLLIAGNKVSFNTHSNVGTTNGFTGTIVGSTMGSYLPPDAKATALTQHVNIYPTIPEEVRASVADNYQSYLYYHVLLESGNLVWIGMPWVIPTSIRGIVVRSCDITLSAFEDTDTNSVRVLLESHNYHVASAVIIN